jgi:hypothetical protein
MDFVKNLTGGGNNNAGEGQQQQASGSEQKSEGGFLGGIGDKLNNAAGGGAQGEKNEDGLDKGESIAQTAPRYKCWHLSAGVDYVQEKFLGQGPQNDENAVEQAKDEQISDFIRGQYKTTTGSDFPIADK